MKKQIILINTRANKLFARVFAFFIFYFYLTSLIGQSSFFVRPIIQNKVFMAASIDPIDNNSAKKPPLVNQTLHNPYVYSENYQSMRSLEVNFGIGLGWTSADKINTLEFSLNTDVAGFKTNTLSRDFSKIYYGSVKPQAETPIQRFSLQYSVLITKKQRFINAKLSANIGAFTNFNDNELIVVRRDFNDYMSPNVIFTSVYFQPYALKRIRPFIGVGVESDFFIKKKYIASLKLDFIKGFGIIEYTDVVHEFNINNQFYESRNRLISKGSGIYLSISRRFQFYPFNKN